MAIRLDLSLPGGDADAGDRMSDILATQTGAVLEVGGKPVDHAFIGVKLGLRTGGVGSAANAVCVADGISCGSSSGLVGVEVQYQVSPGEKIDPWIGYAIAIEWASVHMAGPGGSGDIGLSGIQWAHLMAGLDVRANHYLGVGAVAEMSFGDYLSISSTFDGTNQSIPDANQTTHAWFTLGIRAVLFP
jgi:hypothetical protein